MVLSVPTAPVLGVPSNQISKNVGTMENTGYEFSADYSIINKADLRWNVGFNIPKFFILHYQAVVIL
jgi:hypothetical protein